MKKKSKQQLFIAVGLLAAFIVWTVLVRLVDVQPIGPEQSTVGFAALNAWVHHLTGVNMSLYTVTDWLGLVPIAVALGFGVLGLVQWIQRKHLLRVDRSILALGGFYLAVMAVYVFFEVTVVNRRPILIEGVLEASYPSSTTVLVLCVMPTAMMQLRTRIQSTVGKRGASVAIISFTAFMVVGRLLSGVHWVSDIIGGVLLSAGLVLLYAFAAQGKE